MNLIDRLREDAACLMVGDLECPMGENSADAADEIDRLRKVLEDIAGARGMFGAPPLDDLTWAVGYAEAAVKINPHKSEGLSDG